MSRIGVENCGMYVDFDAKSINRRAGSSTDDRIRTSSVDMHCPRRQRLKSGSSDEFIDASGKQSFGITIYPSDGRRLEATVKCQASKGQCHWVK